jgi:hypothetical protein
MATIWLEWGTDFGVNPNGGLAMAQQWDETRQAFERGMLACPQLTAADGSQIDPDLLYAPNFGAGLGFRIGELPTGQWLAAVQQAANYAAANSPGVNPTIPPVVTLSSDEHTQTMTVVLATTSGPQTLTYAVS